MMQREEEKNCVGILYMCPASCVISEMANENGGKRLLSRNTIACPASKRQPFESAHD